jgi:outer membrane protein OmpA-like peptidoglycan-associated protein
MSGLHSFFFDYRGFLGVVLLAIAGAAHAEVYMAPLDRATWQVEKSPVSCRLHQAVPKYGDVIFETPAGKPQFFYVEVASNPMQSGPATWVATAPSWSPDRAAQRIGSVEVGAGRQPIMLDDVEAQRLLQVLRDGMVPELTRPGRDDAAPVRLGLSPVHFQRAYAQYEECIAQLLPYSFEQMASTPIPFERDRVDLSAAARQKIDLLLRYIRAERRSPRIHIDVLSDDTFRRVENLELSKLRGQSVNDYLVSRGIGQAAISMRHRSVRGGGDLSRRSITIRVQRAVPATAEQAPARPKANNAG